MKGNRRDFLRAAFGGVAAAVTGAKLPKPEPQPEKWGVSGLGTFELKDEPFEPLSFRVTSEMMDDMDWRQSLLEGLTKQTDEMFLDIARGAKRRV